jgi:hypothetical protein
MLIFITSVIFCPLKLNIQFKSSIKEVLVLMMMMMMMMMMMLIMIALIQRLGMKSKVGWISLLRGQHRSETNYTSLVSRYFEMVPYHRGRVYIFFRRSNYSIDA